MSLGEQNVAAFVCALVGNGVTIQQLEGAIIDCEAKLKLGKSIGRLATGSEDETTGFVEAGAVSLAYEYVHRLTEANR